MTDMMSLARRLYQRIEWQNVPDVVAQEDLTVFIADGIRHLYVMTGRALQFTESMFTLEDDAYVSFGANLALDECEYVLVTAEINFYRKVQSDVDELTSYTTDAMALSHGDKPFANLQKRIEDATRQQNMIWYKMIRYHMQ